MPLQDIALRSSDGKKQTLRIIYEDQDILVIDKPPGIPVIPDRWDAQKLNAIDMLYSQIQKNSSTSEQKIWVVHRIDQDTSGLVIFAKNSESHRMLNRSFFSATVKKFYLAIVQGCPEKPDGRIDYALSPQKKGRVLVDPTGKKAITIYRVVEKFSRYSVLEVNPVTGRTHQIRVHLTAIGHPLVVDPLYTAKTQFGITDLKRYARILTEEVPALISRLTLHAMKLKIMHPITKTEMEFTAEIPKDMQAILKALRKWDSIRPGRKAYHPF